MLNSTDLSKVHNTGFELEDVKVTFLHDIKINVAGVDVEGKQGEILNIPRWVANVLEYEKHVNIEDTDMVVELKQATVKENVQGEFELATLEPHFYVRLLSYMKKLPKDDYDKVESMLNSLVRKRQGKIIHLADSSKLTADLSQKLTLEERSFYEKIYNTSVDFNDLVSHPQIESKFNENPDEILAAFTRAIKEILQERFPQYATKIKEEIRARIVNYPVQRSLRQINAEIINKMTSVSGMVVRSSEVKPLAKEITYKCSNDHEFHITLEKGMTVPPLYRCGIDPKCTSKDFTIQPDKSRFIDFQIARLQELPEDLPPGQLPHYVDVTIKQDLVDNARPGDRIILTGIVRIEQEYFVGARSTSGLYRLRIDGNNIEFLGGGGPKTSRKTEREEVSPEEEKIIKSLSGNPDIYNRLVDSFAPHIQGHTLIKEAILLLIAGSTQRLLQDGTKIRGDINIFLVGDPGTAKSEMLKFCARIAPRGLYTSGRGSTAAGLTAAVVRDKSGIMMLEAGAVVLGDQGLVCIDE